jgi:glycosyltransferase involved in cell wall biosynthesis
MAIDLAVLGRDPLFGGGGRAYTEAFLAAAAALGREPTLLFDPHPGLRGPRLTWRRVEALRQLAAARRFEPELRAARSAWVVSTHATEGGAAARSGRDYRCWLATTVDAEWTGRARGLAWMRRAGAAASLPVLRQLERGVLRRASRLYTISASSRTEVMEASGRDDVRVLPIPVDVEHFMPDPEAEWKRTLDQPTLVFVGRADDPRKNVDLLLDSARRLDGVQIRLVGAPPRVALPPNVEATGEVPDVAAALRGATLFVLPSRHEGFGIVAAEALAAGLPVVTTPSGGPEELVRVSGGGRVLAGFDTDGMTAAIAELLADPSGLAAMRRAGREYVEREHSPSRFRELLAEALA